MALTVDQGAYTIYVNGNQVHSGIVTSGASFNRELFLGAMGNGNSWNTWDGDIDDLKIYGSALSVEELGQKQLANTAKTDVIADSNTADLVVYPNPSRSLVTISFAQSTVGEQTTVEVYNTLGQRLYSTITKEQVHQLSVDKLPAGLYFLRVTTGAAKRVRKLMVE